MTTEELRATIIEGIDRILGAPWVIHRWVSAENMRLLRAQRAYWQNETGPGLSRLLDLFQKEP